MDRRMFLKTSLAASVSVAGLPLLHPQRAAAAPVARPAAIALAPVLTGLWTLALNVAAPVIADEVKKWLEGRRSAERDAGRAAGQAATNRGYDIYLDSPVHALQRRFFYGATDDQGMGGYAPFIYPVGRRFSYTFVGGPALFAVGTLSSDLRNYNSADVVANALLPMSGTSAQGPVYTFDSNWWCAYFSASSRVDIWYTNKGHPTQTEHGHGDIQIQLQSRRPTDEPITRFYMIDYNHMFV